jgi:hypothetical protein
MYFSVLQTVTFITAEIASNCPSFFLGATDPGRPGPPHDHTQTRRTQYDSSGRVIIPTQRPPPDKPQHSQERGIHASGGIRTRNRSKPAAADPRLRPRGHWDRLKLPTAYVKCVQPLRSKLHSGSGIRN